MPEMGYGNKKTLNLAGDYVKKVHGYMQGEKAGLYDDGGLTEDAGEGHMSKSTLYQPPHAIELMPTIPRVMTRRLGTKQT